jgi:hypothetical protein
MPKSSKLLPAAPVAPETWRALLSTASDFAALKPWELIHDGNIVGFIDPVTGETRKHGENCSRFAKEF